MPTTAASVSTEYNELSEQFLRALREGSSTESIRHRLSAIDRDELASALSTDEQRYAFWINIYNAYIQAILKEKPELYEDRRTFFKLEQIPLAGADLSFATIEHGILRKSQWDLGLGYIRKWFPGKYERMMRVDKRDYQIHFALNCGARDCPPVAIYTPEDIGRQLAEATRQYVTQRSVYVEPDDRVDISSLFTWFRGDFGGKGGIKNILRSLGVIPDQADPKLNYTDYDWTLDLGNYVDYE